MATSNRGNTSSRFDFGSDLAPDDIRTASLGDLLHEINTDFLPKSGTVFDIKSLETVLRFLRSISGQDLRSVTQKHALSTLKTVKLLFKHSRDSDSHLMRLITLPGGNTPATMDFMMSPPTQETADVRERISLIISALESEIDPNEVERIKAICDPTLLREAYRKQTNELVDSVLLTHIHIDDDLLKEADKHLADQTRRFMKFAGPFSREPRLHVALYTYLKLFDYVHRLHFEVTTKLSIPNDRGVGSKRIDFDRLSKVLSERFDRTITKTTNFMSMSDMKWFFNEYDSDIAHLASEATGFKYNKRDVTNDRNRAIVALQLYLLKAGLPNEVNECPLGVVHVIAAFSAILHQRKTKSNLTKTSKKYSQGNTTPQKQLDALISEKTETDHLTWTTGFIYLERVTWYVHALLERKDKSDSHNAFQIKQSDLMLTVYMTLDHMQIWEHISSYRDYMVRSAHSFIALHGLRSVKYRRMHGN